MKVEITRKDLLRLATELRRRIREKSLTPDDIMHIPLKSGGELLVIPNDGHYHDETYKGKDRSTH